jgi:hypothetical protein
MKQPTVKKLPNHKKVKYMIDKPELAGVLLDHWAGGSTKAFSVKDAKRFSKDVRSSPLTMGEWMDIQWEGMADDKS